MARLTEIRDKCKVYVLPEYVNGRPTEPHGVVHKADKETLDAAAYIEGRLRRAEDYDALFDLDDSDDPHTQALWRLVQYAKGEV